MNFGIELTVLLSKKYIFCQIFRLILHESSSVARMTESEKREKRKSMGMRKIMRQQWNKEQLGMKQ